MTIPKNLHAWINSVLLVLIFTWIACTWPDLERRITNNADTNRVHYKQSHVKP